MTIQQFQDWKKLTDTAFAELVGVNQSTVSRWKRRGSEPDAESFRKIVKATEGAVDYAGVYGEPIKAA